MNLLGYAADVQAGVPPGGRLRRGHQPRAGQGTGRHGLQYAKAADPLAALSAAGVKIAVIAASPANLKTLAANLAKVERSSRRPAGRSSSTA